METTTGEIRLASGRSLEWGKRTLIMGILNVTPDSFSDGGRFFDPDKAVDHALQMVEEGADIIDVGGASSRPNSVMVDEEEELRRILPVVKRLGGKGLIISVDTFRARVAEQALAQGADIINDIGGLAMDPQLPEVMGRWQAPLVIMHNRMQIKTGEPYDNLIADIITELQHSIDRAVSAGLKREQIIIDPGLGFGKSLEQNQYILKQLSAFRSLGRPILIGASRKSFIGKTLGLETEERLEGSLAALAIAIMNGADMVRVHDVKESKRVAVMTDAVRCAHG